MGEDVLEVVSDYVYLGVTFKFSGSFTKAIEKQISQAKRAIFSLITKCRRLHLPYDIQTHLFDTCVTPILLYGCGIWGFSNTRIGTFFPYYGNFQKFPQKLPSGRNMFLPSEMEEMEETQIFILRPFDGVF